MKKAFTLLEMIVVIGIIAILVSLGFASYSTIQKKARDAKRQGDLKAAQQIMEQCYSLNSFAYPTGAGQLSVSGGVITGICPADPTLTFSIQDPSNVVPYVIETSSSTAYKITADIETGTTFSVENQQ